MHGVGTDVVVLAAILGSAAVGGAVTVAALEGDGDGVECVAEAVAVKPRVVVAMGGDAPAVVVMPRMHVHAAHGCAAVVVDDEVRARLDGARARMEGARARAELARIRFDERFGTELEKRLDAEMARLERELERLEYGTVR